MVCVHADSGDDNSIKTGWWWSVSVQTLVTTTALTGKTQALQADAGESYQVELLSAAEAYAADDAEVDAMELVQSQLVRAWVHLSVAAEGFPGFFGVRT